MAGIKVVLKLHGSQPLQKHEMSRYPEDLDELDDVVASELITNGQTWSMKTINSEELTDEHLSSAKLQDKKLVVRVVPQSLAQSFHIATPTPSEALSFENVSLPLVSAEEVRTDVITKLGFDIEHMLQACQENAKDTASGKNRLIEHSKHEMKQYGEIDKKISELTKQGLKKEADRVLVATKKVYNDGLTQLTVSRENVDVLVSLLISLGEAVATNNERQIEKRISKLGEFANETAKNASELTQKFEDHVEHLNGVLADLGEKERSEHSTKRWSAGGAGLAGVGSAGAAGAVASGSVGWTAAGYFTAAAVSSTGVGLLVVAGVAGAAAVGCAARAHVYGEAAVGTEELRKMTQNVANGTNIHTGLWDGIDKATKVAKQSISGLKGMDSEDRERFQQQMVKSARHIQALQNSIDEYLVFASESNLYPINFNVRSIVGRDNYEVLKGILAIKK